MPDFIKNSEETQKKISRSKFLRNSAITATGVALLPSFMTGCRKHWDFPQGNGVHVGGGGGVGVDDLTSEQLKSAADNLNRMRALLYELYKNSFDYDTTVFHALNSTIQEGNWMNFIVDILIDIAYVMIATAAAASGPGGVALAVPALAGASAFLHDWGIGKDRPDSVNGLNGFFAQYQAGQIAMRDAIDQQLGHLTDVSGNYAALREAWKDPIVFNDRTYTLEDLAKSYFPERTNHADEYYALYNPMYDHHKKSVWNLAIMKCCTYYVNSRWTIYIYNDHKNNYYPYHTVVQYAQQVMYPQNPGRYLRAVLQYRYDSLGYSSYELQSWNLGLGGYSLPKAASDVLFMDDTPNHITNPTGLFNRSYVFEQFAPTKPTFLLGNYPKYPSWHELGHDPNANFWQDDDWNFTGGFFPKLTH